ncbi:MAG TPA: hypothetical protein DCP69_10835 [Candidatus Omnitrophica bacterium]|nr:hypothetical protein [Candidatus Omnitrophota bacterium]
MIKQIDVLWEFETRPRPVALDTSKGGITFRRGDEPIFKVGAKELVRIVLELAGDQPSGEWARKLHGALGRV